MQQLQAQHMLGTAVAAGDTYVTFTVPDDDKVLEGSGDNSVARLVVYDNKAHRASAIDATTVLSLKAAKKPLSLPLIGGIAGLLVVIVLLVMVLLRGGGGGRKKGGGTPPPPGYGPPPGGGYGGPGAPPGGYGAPPQGGYGPPQGYGGAPGGGYHAQQGAPDPLGATAAAPPGFGTALAPAVPMGAPMAPIAPLAPVAPPGAPFAAGIPSQPLFAAPAQPPPGVTPLSNADSGAGPPPIVRINCPSCGMSTMATPGQNSVCFSCGHPIPGELTKGGGGAGAPGFRPGPDASLAPPTAATLRGSAGQYMIRPGTDVRVGRDPGQCTIFLPEPRVSGVHATLRFESGQLLVRDETSNNGTWVSGARIVPGTWTAVPTGTPLRFGPVEFSVQFES
jgi:hypothetical protein